MMDSLLHIPLTSPERIFALRESAFACDLFITAVSFFDFFNWLNKSPSDVDTICNSLNIKKRPADVMLTLFKAYGFVKEREKNTISRISQETTWSINPASIYRLM